jgi:hypothetical protein
MKASQDQMRAEIKINQQETKAFQVKVEDSHEKKEAQMKACREAVEVTIKASQEQMRAKTKTGLEEMKATESEAGVDHCDGLSRQEATHVSLQDWACDVLHGGPKGATFKETIGALEDQFGGQHLDAGCCDQQKTDPNP